MKQIVIVGGGFGGVSCAKELLKKIKRKNINAKVTLISEHNYFLFTPMLHEVATGGLSRENIIVPINTIFKNPSFIFVKEKVREIDTKQKQVICSSCCIAYDVLILATGSRAHFFSIPGAEEYTVPLRTLQNAHQIRNKVIAQLEKAVLLEKNEKRKKELTFAIIGAGPTGVELAGELSEFIDAFVKSHQGKIEKKEITILLVHRGKEILDMLPAYYSAECRKRLEKLGVTLALQSEVTKVEREKITLKDGTKKQAALIFWTAGFAANTIPIDKKHYNSYEINMQGNILIAEKKEKLKNIFALGDCSTFIVNGIKAPMLAQVAVKQAPIIAHNALDNLGFGKQQKEYVFSLDGFLISVGQYFAVAGIKDVYFSGFFSWWLWRTIYLTKLYGWKNKIRVALDWTLNFFYPRDTSEVE
ncbi:NAD(P)/FAD-dependent oxidoreductase [Candidatus Woesearchaeota archaeon]|nr:NAD(P)/FAD-dependent oxidoreductase [Candidatus Woesearchaeota archaeon]